MQNVLEAQETRSRTALVQLDGRGLATLVHAWPSHSAAATPEVAAFEALKLPTVWQIVGLGQETATRAPGVVGVAVSVEPFHTLAEGPTMRHVVEVLQDK